MMPETHCFSAPCTRMDAWSRIQAAGRRDAGFGDRGSQGTVRACRACNGK